MERTQATSVLRGFGIFSLAVGFGLGGLVAFVGTIQREYDPLTRTSSPINGWVIVAGFVIMFAGALLWAILTAFAEMAETLRDIRDSLSGEPQVDAGSDEATYSIRRRTRLR